MRYFFILLICLLKLSGCKTKYSFTGASIAPDVKTVSVKFIANNAPLASPILSQVFTEALRDIFITQTNLKLKETDGDLALEGEITGYQTQPTAILGNETAARNRLTITVNIRFNNTKDETQKFEQSFSRYADFNANQQLSAVENQLIKEINTQLAQDIFNRAVSNW